MPQCPDCIDGGELDEIEIVANRTLSTKGLAFIAQHEGFSPIVYADQAGNPTIGFGHLIDFANPDGSMPEIPEVFSGGITREQGLELLEQDAKIAEEQVINHIDTQLNQPQFDALVSFTFNVGGGALETSTLRRLINSGVKDPAKIRNGFKLFNKVRIGGKLVPSQGLTNRREAEANLFINGIYNLK